MQILFVAQGGGGVHKVHYGLCESGKSPLGEHGPITREMITVFTITIKIGNLIKLIRKNDLRDGVGLIWKTVVTTVLKNF